MTSMTSRESRDGTAEEPRSTSGRLGHFPRIAPVQDLAIFISVVRPELDRSQEQSYNGNLAETGPAMRHRPRKWAMMTLTGAGQIRQFRSSKLHYYVT
jgi:hypothetical protein